MARHSDKKHLTLITNHGHTPKEHKLMYVIIGLQIIMIGILLIK